MFYGLRKCDRCGKVYDAKDAGCPDCGSVLFKWFEKKKVHRRTLFCVTWMWANGIDGKANIPKGILDQVVQSLLNDSRLCCVKVDNREWAQHIKLYGGLVIKEGEPAIEMTSELCPKCDIEVDIPDSICSDCPNCGARILPCSTCPSTRDKGKPCDWDKIHWCWKYPASQHASR